MSGILNLAVPDLSAPEPLKALPRSLGERIDATAAETFSPARYFNVDFARRDMWQRAIDELHATTGEALPNPYADRVTAEEIGKFGNQAAAREERRNKIINASRLARAQGNDDLFDPENIDRYIAEEDQRRKQTAASYVDTGNGVGNFLASVLMSSVEPINAATLFLPVSRLPTAAASAIGRSFLGNVAREAALQGAVNVAVQGLTDVLDAKTRAEIGIPTDMRDVAGNLVTAAAFGAFLGGGVRALHLKWLGLPEKVRADAPLEVRDAFRVIEADALYSGQNRIGIDPLLHERYQGRAYDAVMRGTPVRLEELAPVDTPMTALGTILRSTPDQIRVSGLADAIDRVRMLPDTELEPIVRQLKPQAFTQLDEIDAKLKALDDRVSAIRQQAEQIGPADVIDMDTASILQDIDQRLSQKGLRRQVRDQLEHERRQWLETLDVHGRLTDDLQRMRQEFFPEHGPALKQIEAERASLMQDRARAQQEVQREVDFLKGKLDKIDLRQPEQAVKSLGVEARADLPAMLQRAEFDRQIRLAREIAPEGISPEFKPASDIGVSTPAKEITPEVAKAVDTEIGRLIDDAPEVTVGGKTMAAKEALDEADRAISDAKAAQTCLLGGGALP